MSMMFTRFMVMSFPFITLIEKNEKQKRLDAISLKKKGGDYHNENNTINASKEVKPVKAICQKDIGKSANSNDMICLSNLEEIVFYTSTDKCLLDEICNSTNKSTPPVDYDKYLHLFE